MNMVINCLRNAKRFRATVSFIADTGRKVATDFWCVPSYPHSIHAETHSCSLPQCTNISTDVAFTTDLNSRHNQEYESELY
jgi:hypothetical protein